MRRSFCHAPPSRGVARRARGATPIILAAAAVLMPLVMTARSQARPVDPSLSAGAVSVSRDGNQSDSSARMLHRITGPDPAAIAGSIHANTVGHFVNPAALVFAPTAAANSGIHAAAGRTAGDNFLTTVNRFADVKGNVLHQQAITGDAAHLVDRGVINTGAVRSNQPLLAVVAGNDVYIGEHDGKVFARVDGRTLLGDRATPNHASLDGRDVRHVAQANAGAGRTIPTLAAGDVFALAIHRRAPVRSNEPDASVAATRAASGPEMDSVSPFARPAHDISPGAEPPGVAGVTQDTFSFDVDPYLADLDGDFVIGPMDRDILLAQWGPCGPGSCPADLTGDGIVNGLDLAVLLGFWGALVPLEPGPDGGPPPGPGPGPGRGPLNDGTVESLATRAVIEGIAATEPTDGTESRVTDRLLLDPLAREALQRLNIDVRDLQPQELVDNTLGREIYNDVGQRAVAGPDTVRVAVNRLRRSSIVMVVQQYSRLFLEGAGEAGNDDRHDQRVAQVRASFETAWRDVSDQSGSGSQRAAALRRVIESSPDHAPALEALNRLGVMLRELYISGLNGHELERITPRVLSPLTPRGLEPWELEIAAVRGDQPAVHGP